jgi:hypothetical protein
MFHCAPRELETKLTPEDFAELCAYQAIKAEAIDNARKKPGAMTGPERKPKMGTQRRKPA